MPPPISRPYCCATCENAADLIDGGQTPQTTASRLGTTPGALKVHLERHGHHQYANLIPVTKPEKEPAA